jgi:hypothetical protein
MEKANSEEVTTGNEYRHPVLMDQKAAAVYLGGLSTKTLESWRVRGIGPVFRKIGALCRYLQADLDAYIQAQARRSTSEAGASER